jgi:GTP 3',8-cyclase
MTVAYRFHGSDSLYVNLVKRYACNNGCLFCSKPGEPGTDNVYEKAAGTSLYLSESPRWFRVMGAIGKEITKQDREVAVVGLGESLLNFDLVEHVVAAVKRCYDVRTRVDTNGLVSCWIDDPVERLDEAGLDEIRISLNATSDEEYQRLCKPRVNRAFEALVEFVRECVVSSIDTKVSFVSGFEDRRVEELVEFAQSLGVREEDVILRPYVHL